MASLGAILPIVVIAAVYLALGTDWTVLGIVLGVAAGLCIVSYIVAAVAATTRFGEFMRGWLIGLNAVLNGLLGFGIVALSGNVPAAAVVGVVLAAINILCVLAPVTQNGFFQGVLGWLNWLMPMSWLVVALGIVFYAFSLLLWGVTGGKVEYLRVQKAGADWKTGTFFIKGGLIANLNYLDTAFNMGNFSFVDYKSADWHKDHEAGHTLNLAAFGSVFHFIGAIDENALRGENAFAERLAESNVGPTSSRPKIAMWS
jgi:hypothetical protein